MRNQSKDDGHEPTLSRRIPGGGEMLSAREMSLMFYLLHKEDGIVEMPKAPGEFIPVPTAVRDLLIAALNRLSNGDQLPLPPLDSMITVEQASDIMGVSKAELNGMLDEGKISHVSTGEDRRLARADILTHLGRERARQREAAATTSDLERVSGSTTPRDAPGSITTRGNT